MKLRLLLPALFAVAAACARSEPGTADTAQVAPAAPISADSAAKLDSATRHDSVKPTAFKLQRIPLSLVMGTAEAQTTAVASRSTAPAVDTGHRRYHWPYLLALVLIALAAYAVIRRKIQQRSAANGGYRPPPPTSTAGL